jgi:predicted Zn-dependent protease
MSHSEQLEQSFDQAVTYLRGVLGDREAFVLELVGEVSQFLRFNRAKVRQTGQVKDGHLTLTLMEGDRSSRRSFPLSGQVDLDLAELQANLTDLRQELPQLPTDPYLVLPSGQQTSRTIQSGQLLPPKELPARLLTPVAQQDFVGFYAGGEQLRAYADSSGNTHWFATESFVLDYSLFAENGQAVKGTFADGNWHDDAYLAKMQDSLHQLAQCDQPAKSIPRGVYRTYLAPAAVAELLSMLSWGALSEFALQRGESSLGFLRRGEKMLSPHFNLRENFGRGLVPRFNAWGELAPVELPLIQQGRLVTGLTNARTAKEYGLQSNGANNGESLRSPEMSPGSLPVGDVLQTLETGLYLSNLHYLNWSDRTGGRITGMTRYACFWVEQGELIAPIEHLRFDESLYRCFGEKLVALTDQVEFIPEVGTYSHRDLGGSWVPGMLIDDFTYTL